MIHTFCHGTRTMLVTANTPHSWPVYSLLLKNWLHRNAQSSSPSVSRSLTSYVTQRPYKRIQNLVKLSWSGTPSSLIHSMALEYQNTLMVSLSKAHCSTRCLLAQSAVQMGPPHYTYAPGLFILPQHTPRGLIYPSLSCGLRESTIPLHQRCLDVRVPYVCGYTFVTILPSVNLG